MGGREVGGITEDNPGLAVRATISILMTEEEDEREVDRERRRQKQWKSEREL